MSLSRTLLLAALLAAVVLTGCRESADELDTFLADYNVLYRDLWQRAEGARWDANVNVGEATSATRVAAEEEFAARLGEAGLIAKARAFLERDDLTFVQRQQLKYVLLNAAKFPGTIPEVTTRLISAGAPQPQPELQQPASSPSAMRAYPSATARRRASGSVGLRFSFIVQPPVR